MQLSEDCRLAYVIAHEAWYGQIPDVIDGPHVSVTASATGGGAAWEFVVEQRDLGNHTAIRLGIFDDAFLAFEQIPEFFAALGEKTPGTLDDVVEILVSLGAVDETERTKPAR